MKTYFIKTGEECTGIELLLANLGLLERNETACLTLARELSYENAEEVRLDSLLRDRVTPFILVTGSNYYHHISYFVLRDLLDKQYESYDCVVFDAHVDINIRNNRNIHCGSVFHHALRRTKLNEVFFYEPTMMLELIPPEEELGVSVNEDFGSEAHNCHLISEDDNWEPTKPFYVSIDMDVLDPCYALVNFDRNDSFMRLNKLLYEIARLSSNDLMIGMDVCGHRDLVFTDLRTAYTIASILNAVQQKYPVKDLGEAYASLKGIIKNDFWSAYFKNHPEEERKLVFNPELKKYFWGASEY